jgi:hypothetical protein
MCRRCIRVLLLVTGCGLLFFAVFPVLAFVQVGEPWQTALVASKLVMLPVGAICLLGAAKIQTAQLPR